MNLKDKAFVKVIMLKCLTGLLSGINNKMFLNV